MPKMRVITVKRKSPKRKKKKKKATDPEKVHSYVNLRAGHLVWYTGHRTHTKCVFLFLDCFGSHPLGFVESESCT